MVSISRKRARQVGSKTYNGPECVVCEETERYTISSLCINYQKKWHKSSNKHGKVDWESPRQKAKREGKRVYTVDYSCASCGGFERLVYGGCIVCGKEKKAKSQNNLKLKRLETAINPVHCLADYDCEKCGFGGDIRYITSGKCVSCVRKYDEVKAKNLTEEQIQAKRESDKRYKNKNKKRRDIRRRPYIKQYYEDNKEKILKQSSEWTKNNPGKANNQRARRIARKKQAMPSWANKKEIEAFYLVASGLTRETDTKYEVDHIIPLYNKKVCGLHVPWNLQILTMKENRSKGNKFEVDW